MRRRTNSRSALRSSGCVSSGKVIESSESASLPSRRHSAALTDIKLPSRATSAIPIAAAWKAPSKLERASASSASARCSSVTSRTTEPTPMSSPNSSRKADTVTATSISSPSLRRACVSSGTAGPSRKASITPLTPSSVPSGHNQAAQIGQLPAGLFRLSHHDRLEWRHVQPCDYRVHAGGTSRHATVRRVPCQQQLQPDQRSLLELPPDRLQWHHQPAAPSRRVPARLLLVPWIHGPQLDQRHLQPHNDRVHADRLPYQPAVRPMPREQQLQIGR